MFVIYYARWKTYHLLRSDWHFFDSGSHIVLSGLTSYQLPSNLSWLSQWFLHLHQPWETKNRMRPMKPPTDTKVAVSLTTINQPFLNILWSVTRIDKMIYRHLVELSYVPCKVTVNVSKDLHEVRMDRGEANTGSLSHMDSTLLCQVHMVEVDELKLGLLLWPEWTDAFKDLHCNIYYRIMRHHFLLITLVTLSSGKISQHNFDQHSWFKRFWSLCNRPFVKTQYII